GGVVGNATGAENRFTRRVVVDVAADGGIELFDGRFVQFHSGLLFHPALELGVGWARRFDKVNDGVAIESETIDHHLIVAFATARIARGELAARFEREFEPKPGEVHNTQWSGHARTNERNSRIHNFSCFGFY